MSAVAVLTVAALTWFGPAPVSFEAVPSGNPFDFRANDVRVVFVASDGHREERLAYFEAGRWKAWLATTHPATYQAALTRNGQPVEVGLESVTIAETARIPGGYVRAQGTRFVDGDDQPFFPLGHNLGWQHPGILPLVEQLRGMGAGGMNWTRIWACAWDGKNPFIGRGPPPPAGALIPPVLRHWDNIITAAEASGVRLQMVLFHHGLFSSDVNSNWNEHPWNKIHPGGFLARPQDFFTDATARDYTQRWLRHAVARWGHSPAIFAWELFNEVEWVDTVRQDHDWATVAAWHADMAAFLRSIDPYDHLITTSSSVEDPALYAAMDYYQPHIYTRNLNVAIGGTPPLPDKPWFFGEFGGNAHGAAAPDEKHLLRDGIWASILAGHAGAAGYWYWERVAQLRFASEYTRAARALELSDLPARADVRPVAVGITGAAPAPLVFAPGRGWGATETHTFRLPADATPAKLVGLSSYLRGPNPARPDFILTPLELHFTAPADATATIALLGSGQNGAGLQVLLDGQEVSRQTWPPTEPNPDGPSRGRTNLPPVSVHYKAGPHVLTLRSTGPDWVQFDQITLPDLGGATNALAIGNANFVLARVTSTLEGQPAKVDLFFAGLADGEYELKSLDLDTGREGQQRVVIADGTLHDWPAIAQDVVLVLTR